MATEKRQRQKSNREVKVAEQRKQAKQQAVRRRFIYLGSIVAVVVGGLLLVNLLSGDDTTDTTDSSPLTLGTTTTTAGSESTQQATTSSVDSDNLPSAVSAPAPGATITGETPCPEADGSSERVTSFENRPPMCIDEAMTYTAEITTNLGSFTIDLDATAAPLTVNNFVVLAGYHYYDGAPFHRIIPDFVIQGGDAVGDPLGTGDPGYSFDDELPSAGDYQVGSVAMANSGPDTNGSQFFVITGADGAGLPPSYSLFGTVSDGLEVVKAIEAIPTNRDDAPTESVVIESVTITES